MVHLKLKKELKPDRINIIQGSRDILPELQELYDLVKRVFGQRARQAGFSKFSTPIIEKAELFERGLGFSTEILTQNQLYKFKINGEDVVLKPELTLGICRSYIENALSQEHQPLMFYSFDKVFRNNKVTSKIKEFHQFGMEVFGEVDSGIDAHLIHLGWQILGDLKVRDGAKLRLNSVGSHKTRKKFARFSTDYFEGKRKVLCNSCQDKIELSPWRIHSCKEEDCQIICSKSPKIKDFWMDDDKAFHEEVLELLDAIKVPYTVSDRLITEQDYYSRTVFEIVDENGDKMLGGGRYDLLMTHLGGENIPGSGFSIDVENIIDKMVKIGVQSPIKNKIDVFVGQLGKTAKLKAFPLIEKLQNLGIRTMGGVGQPSIKGQMAMAEKSNAKFALIMGTLEVRDNTIILRDMKKGVQEQVSFDDIIDILLEKIGNDNLDNNKFIDEIYIETPKEETDEEKYRKKKRSRFNG